MGASSAAMQAKVSGCGAVFDVFRREAIFFSEHRRRAPARDRPVAESRRSVRSCGFVRLFAR